ncbi:C4b-binding protein alpha chain-like [Pelodytes ibericus]
MRSYSIYEDLQAFTDALTIETSSTVDKSDPPSDSQWRTDQTMFPSTCLVWHKLGGHEIGYYFGMTIISGTCGPPPEFDYAMLGENSADESIFYEGIMIYYKCRPGYARVTNTKNSVTCLENLTWSSPDIFCAPACKHPAKLEYGKLREEYMDQDEFPRGAVLNYECNPGYTRVPNTKLSIVCLQSLQWSAPDIFCARTCGSPPRLQYGELKQKYVGVRAFFKGAIVEYSCRPGYIRVAYAKPSIKCLEHLEWSTPDIFCQRRSCGNPGDIFNGEFEAEDFLFGSKVIYKCNSGFKMITRRNYRECLADGSWSNSLPECEAAICNMPLPINNGLYSPEKEEYQYLDSVTYSCDTSLHLIGEASPFCTAHGNWSSEAPQCKVVRCDNPYVANSRKLSGFTNYYTLHYSVRFECYTGYMMIGSSTVVCNINSNWEPELPKCVGVCRRPQLRFAEMDESSDDQENFLEGVTLQYSCILGYESISGQKPATTCFGKNQWTPKGELCTRKSCGSPGSILNGEMIIFSDFLYQSQVYYICFEGFKLTSNSTLCCQADGTWDNPKPSCDEITCDPPVISNGTYTPKKDIYHYNEVLIFTCKDNLRLIGNSSVACVYPGHWNSPAPTCEAVCDSPPILEHAALKEYVGINYFDVNTAVHYQCKPGYTRVPATNNTITCSTNLTWSSPEKFCTRLSCGYPGKIKNGRVEASDFLFGTKAYYSCNTGYSIESQIKYRECQADGNWTEAIPECKVKTCPFPTPVTDGFYSPLKDEFHYLDSITYGCNKGLFLFGKSSISCTEDGTWSSDIPQCKVSQCDKIWAVQEEMRKCSSTPEDWIKYLQVQYLYLQIENLKLDIEKKKKERGRNVV